MIRGALPIAGPLAGDAREGWVVKEGFAFERGVIGRGVVEW